jgi:hypothetical protein
MDASENNATLPSGARRDLVLEVLLLSDWSLRTPRGYHFMVINRNPWRNRRHRGRNAKYFFVLDHVMMIFRAFRRDDTPEVATLKTDASYSIQILRQNKILRDPDRLAPTDLGR